MLLQLHNYDVTIKYWPGKEILVADALSCNAPLKAQVIPLDITISHMHIKPDKKTEFQTLIQDDPLLHFLTEMIIAGWPDNISDVPCALCPCHVHRNILTVEDDLILWGKALIIPLSEREKILQTIHEGHCGISKCQNRARHCVYWPGINSDIKHLVESCPICQCHCPQEPQQPLQPTLAPECPWQLLGTDYVHFDRSEYLVVIYYYSKMPIIWRIPASQCNASNTISVLKELSAGHGIPEVLCTDNGPQFSNALFIEFATDWKFEDCLYIEESSRTFGERFKEHLKAPSLVYDHFNTTGDNVTIDNFSIVGREDQN